jgi:signal transduction histidine kinase
VRSARLQLTLWYLGSFVATIILFGAITYFHLQQELRSAAWKATPPDHPTWAIKESLSEDEVNHLLGHLLHVSLVYSVPFVVIATSVGVLLARKSIHPIACLNTQLQLIGPKNLYRRVSVAQGDAEYRQLQAHINSLLDRLETAFTQLGDFSAKVAHELKTPLTILRLRVEQEAGQSDAEFLEAMQDELKRLSDYIDRMLLLARAEQGRIPVSLEPLPIHTIIAELIDTYSVLAESEHRSIRFRCPKGCVVQFDRQYFRQILNNILTNAIRHGTGPILVHARVAGAYTSLVCINRVNPGVKRSTLGVGLGLRLVQGLAGAVPGASFYTAKRRGYFIARLRLTSARELATLEDNPVEKTSNLWRATALRRSQGRLRM